MAWLELDSDLADEFAAAQEQCAIALTYAERRSMQAFEPVKPWDIGRLKEWISANPEKRKKSVRDWAQRNRVMGRPHGRQPLTPEQRERRNEGRRKRYAAQLELERQKTLERTLRWIERHREEINARARERTAAARKQLQLPFANSESVAA